MSKQILVMMCAINLDNQRKLLEGMIEAVKETSDNLYVFANYVSYKDKLEHIQGSYQIMRLPDFKQFDGVIFAPNTIQYRPAAEYVQNAIRESGIAAVSIDSELLDMAYLGVASYEAEFDMVEHFIIEHGAKEIVYVSGPFFRPEGAKRYQAYCDAMKKHGLPVKDENVYEGTFATDSGYEIAKKLLKRKDFPKYIICANDAMAMAVIDVFKDKGIRVPEDVKVAGFDDSEMCELQNPSLTTINKNQHYAGYHAVKEILSQISGEPPKYRNVPCELIFRRSCGCKETENYDINKFRDRYIHSQVYTQRATDIMRNMSAEYSGLENPEDLVEATKKYIEELGLEEFYLCLCERDKLFGKKNDDLTGSVDLMQENLDYTEEITIPLAYEDGYFTEYGRFAKGLVLPEECRKRNGGNYFVVVPIYYQRCSYGYCVCGNSRFPMDSSLFYACVMNIGIGFENIRKWMLLKDTVKRLNDMWIYDTMTGIYNRAGFYYYAEQMFQEMQEYGEQIFLIFVDVDGLKEVNDTLGHEAGDNLIREMAEAIKLTETRDRIGMRYGGDEFVLFGKCQIWETEESLLEELRSNMELRNRRSRYPFKLRASIGISIYEAKEVDKLEKMVELADKKMYEEKRQKKIR